jgi:hypothetical protein
LIQALEIEHPTLNLVENNMTYPEHPLRITLAALIAGAVIALIGIFMWAGAWAAMAALGFILVLVALAALVGYA